MPEKDVFWKILCTLMHKYSTVTLEAAVSNKHCEKNGLTMYAAKTRTAICPLCCQCFLQKTDFAISNGQILGT